MALMVLEPKFSPLVVMLAWPLVRITEDDWVTPLMVKVTDPVGVRVLGAALTVAVKVTAVPVVVGFCDELMVVLVAAWPTVWLNVAEVLPV